MDEKLTLSDIKIFLKDYGVKTTTQEIINALAHTCILDELAKQIQFMQGKDPTEL